MLEKIQYLKRKVMTCKPFLKNKSHIWIKHRVKFPILHFMKTIYCTVLPPSIAYQ